MLLELHYLVLSFHWFVCCRHSGVIIRGYHHPVSKTVDSMNTKDKQRKIMTRKTLCWLKKILCNIHFHFNDALTLLQLWWCSGRALMILFGNDDVRKWKKSKSNRESINRHLPWIITKYSSSMGVKWVLVWIVSSHERIIFTNFSSARLFFLFVTPPLWGMHWRDLFTEEDFTVGLLIIHWDWSYLS